VGLALEVMEKLAVEIGALLEKHKDSLEHSEEKPRTISYNMWIGRIMTYVYRANPCL